MLSNLNDLLCLNALVQKGRLKRPFVLSQGNECGTLSLLSSSIVSGIASGATVLTFLLSIFDFIAISISCLIKHSSWDLCGISIIHSTFEGLIISAFFKASFWSFLYIDICGDNSWAQVLGGWICPWYCTLTERGFWTSCFSVSSVWFLSLFLESPRDVTG